MVLKRLQFHCDRLGVLPPEQGGFRRGQSSEDQALLLTQCVHMSWAAQQDHVAIFLDVAKAFDSVWLEGLLYKLERLAHLPPSALTWFRSYLLGRKVKVKVSDAVSKSIPVFRGLPQGAILSPILFSIFVSDFPTSMPRKVGVIQYADDTALHSRVPRSTSSRNMALENIQKALNNTVKWYGVWRLALATNKTKLRLFTPADRKGHPSDSLNLTLGDSILSQDSDESTRYLGVWFDSHLNFESHVKKVSSKALSRVSILRALAGKDWGTERNTRICLYKTLGETGVGIRVPLSVDVNIQVAKGVGPSPKGGPSIGTLNKYDGLPLGLGSRVPC